MLTAVFLDSLAASALGCLRQFEAQGGAVLWESPALVDLKEKEAARANELAEARASNGTLVAPRNRVHHGACSEYFDQGSTGLIVGGIDAALANAFGAAAGIDHTEKHDRLISWAAGEPWFYCAVRDRTELRGGGGAPADAYAHLLH